MSWTTTQQILYDEVRTERRFIGIYLMEPMIYRFETYEMIRTQLETGKWKSFDEQQQSWSRCVRQAALFV